MLQGVSVSSGSRTAEPTPEQLVQGVNTNLDSTSYQLGMLIRKCQESLNQEQAFTWKSIATLRFDRLKEDLSSLAHVRIAKDGASIGILVDYFASLRQLNIFEYFKQPNAALFPTLTRLDELLGAAQSGVEIEAWNDLHFLVPPEALVEDQKKSRTQRSSSIAPKKVEGSEGASSKPKAQTKTRSRTQDNKTEPRSQGKLSLPERLIDYSYSPSWMQYWLANPMRYDQICMPKALIKNCEAGRAEVVKSFVDFTIRRTNLLKIKNSVSLTTWQKAVDDRYSVALSENAISAIKAFLLHLRDSNERLLARFVLCADLYPFLLAEKYTHCDTRGFLCVPYTVAPLTAGAFAWANSNYKAMLLAERAGRGLSAEQVYGRCLVVGQYLDDIWRGYKLGAHSEDSNDKSRSDLAIMGADEWAEYDFMNGALTQSTVATIDAFVSNRQKLLNMPKDEMKKIIGQFHLYL